MRAETRPGQSQQGTAKRGTGHFIFDAPPHQPEVGRLGRMNHFGDPFRDRHGVRVQKQQIFSRGGGNAPIPSSIGRRHWFTKTLDGGLFKDRPTAIGRAIVHHNDLGFLARIGLALQTGKNMRQTSGFVAARNDDRYRGMVRRAGHASSPADVDGGLKRRRRKRRHPGIS